MFVAIPRSTKAMSATINPFDSSLLLRLSHPHAIKYLTMTKRRCILEKINQNASKRGHLLRFSLQVLPARPNSLVSKLRSPLSYRTAGVNAIRAITYTHYCRICDRPYLQVLGLVVNFINLLAAF